MIPYYGLPIWPAEAAAAAINAGHAFVSARRPEQLALALEVCQSLAIDNGAFSAWKDGQPITDLAPFYEWAAEVAKYPSVDFVVIPDVIDGTERDNDRLVDEWPLPRSVGAPVWHMHEGLDRLARLAHEWPRICLGSSGEFSKVGTPAWWARMRTAMLVLCDHKGRPVTKLHGLRMLNPAVFSRLPLASADSTNIARNIPIDSRWKGTYPAPNKPARAMVMRWRVEAEPAATTWSFNP